MNIEKGIHVSHQIYCEDISNCFGTKKNSTCLQINRIYFQNIHILLTKNFAYFIACNEQYATCVQEPMETEIS